MNSVMESVSLLIATSRAEEAESLVESLRGGGLTVRAIGSRTPERLKELVTREGVELILCCAYDPEVDLETWMAQHGRLGEDVPLIIIADESTDSGVVADALHTGASGLITKGDTDHLRALIARELSDLEPRRAGSRPPMRLEQREKRSRDLVDAEGLGPRTMQEGRLPIDPNAQKNANSRCATSVTFVDSATPTQGEPVQVAARDHLLDRLQPEAAKPREARESDRDGAAADEEGRIAGRIQRTLDSDGFELFYQPIVSLKGDRRESYQVLLRLPDGDGTLRAAKDFLDIANRSGTMAAVDRWVFHNAIAKLAARRSKGQTVNFFVDIAETTLQEERLLVWICDSLRDCKARGNWLTLQILEEHALRNAAVFNRLSNGLRKVGCRIALDRFGEGQKPETLLRSLRLDYVKFPPDLGNGLAGDRAKRRRLQELTKLSGDAGVKNIVTGLEDARSLTILWTAGIDYAQGNFLQRPSPMLDQE